MDKHQNAVPQNGFAQLLVDHREGWALDEASEKLSQLVEAVRSVGKSGTLTVQIKVSPASKGAGNAVSIMDKVTAKIPEHDRDSSIMFATDDHRLQREDPRQRRLPFATVKKPDIEVAQVEKEKVAVAS